ncbi:hypothetical protein MMC25_008148 [Agyrium rufum]|nr:hypothetical protein [Agyrium rufum]
MGFRSLVLAAAVLAAAVVHAQETNITGPIAQAFLSRPDLNSITLNVTLHDDSSISPGYIFLAPYQVLNPGPYIFDNTGALIWTGYSVTGPASSHDFKVCSYNGTDHLCMYQGNQLLGYARGHDLIMDDSFSIVKSIQSGNGLPGADQHEANYDAEGKSIVMTVYDTRAYDLSDYNITDGQGWVMQGCFQDIDIETNDVLFEWHSLDHIDLSAGYILPNTTDVSGDGTSKDSAWDYFHINAVDKFANGDYIVSARHAEALYKIDGTNGSVIWQLGGKTSSFTQNNYNFSFQHDVRVVSENSTTTVISIFDNAYNGFNGSSAFSTGKIIAIDNTTMSSTLLQNYTAPDPAGGIVSASQGNMQILPNGNVFVGFGSQAYVAEFTAEGDPVLYAHFATTGALQYRSYKFNFTSSPKDTPAIYTYARNTSAPTAYYVSWNGATEVDSWTFYSGPSADNLTAVGNVKKVGFESVSTASSFYAYTVAEAVAANGTGIRNSTLTSTFVPGSDLAAKCSEIQCPLVGGSNIEPQVQGLSPTPTAAVASSTPTNTNTASSSTSSSDAKTNAAFQNRVGWTWLGLLGIAGFVLAWT